MPKQIFNAVAFSKAVLTKRVVECKLKVREAAAEIGVSPATVSRIENERNPDVNSFFLVCKWLGKSTEEFIINDKKTKLKK